jgi:hypothetical protein
LLPRLAQEHCIELFSESFSRSELGLPHHHYLNAYKRHESEPFDIFFYQLEDGRSSRFVRGHIGLMPGVVWVHDLFCKDLGPEACHTSPWETTIRQYLDGDQPFADRLVAPHQLWPRVYREVSLSPVVLCSSRWAYNEFLRMTSNRLEASDGAHSAQVLPIPVSARRNHSHGRVLNPEMLSIACNSVSGIEGRAHKFLPVLKKMPGAWRLVWMLDSDEISSAQALVREFGISEQRVSFVSPRSPDAWGEVVKDSDVALHLHTSTFGHLAPYLQLTMAEGCPAIVAQSGQGEDIPNNVAFHIIPGVHESAQIEAVLEAVRKNGRDALGGEGMRYISASADSADIARTLSAGFRRWAPQLREVMQRWQELQRRAQRELLGEVRHLVCDKSAATPDPFDVSLLPSIKELGWA